ncbi:hypothetical protein [Streptomyces lydicus]|uniref:hypothetical protein n=1 Tax=Streptomyces lydicus TaxID=47763 RepID=UPI0037AAC367
MPIQPDPIADMNAAMTRDLGQVLDVEAGLAEVLSTATAEDAHRAAAVVNDALATLFQRLGPPPTDRADEK